MKFHAKRTYGYLRNSKANLSPTTAVNVAVHSGRDRIELNQYTSGLGGLSLVFTAEQAMALGNELIAAANARAHELKPCAKG